MSILPRPLFTALEAVARARAAINSGTYVDGTGDIDTPHDGPYDCCGFATCWCYGIRRHRPRFNVGAWATVSDDINCNSSIEDARHGVDLFEPLLVPELGALLKWPTIRLPGHPLPIEEGHESIVVGVDRSIGRWDPSKPDYRLLDVVQCEGPNGRRPGIILSDGEYWYAHDLKWPKPEHRTWMLRVRP